MPYISIENGKLTAVMKTTSFSCHKSERVKAQDFKKDPAITVYTPKNPSGKTVLMCPGGGYSHEASAHEGHDMADWYNAQGITYAVLKYRLPYGDNSIPLADAEQAMRILRRYADDLGVDPKKVGIAGASAGGHLASTLATHYSSPETRPDFQILFYPVVSMDAQKTHMGSRICESPQYISGRFSLFRISPEW